MAIENVKILDDKKFMWDGKIYESEEEAKKIISSYEAEGFEVRMILQENKYIVYTRRVVTEIVVEGQP